MVCFIRLPRAYRCDGFTLLETLMSCTILLVLCTAVLGVWSLSRGLFADQETEARVQQGGVAALALLQRLLKPAGLVEIRSGDSLAVAAMSAGDRLAERYGPAVVSIHGCDDGYRQVTDLSDRSCASTSVGTMLQVAYEARALAGQSDSALPTDGTGCLGSPQLQALDGSGQAVRYQLCRIRFEAANRRILLGDNSPGNAQVVIGSAATDASRSVQVADFRVRYGILSADGRHLDAILPARDISDWSRVAALDICLLLQARADAPPRARRIESCTDNAQTRIEIGHDVVRAFRATIALPNRLTRNAEAAP